jgi:hypothetical protein
MKGTIDNVMLSQTAINKWIEIVKTSIPILAAKGLRSDQIGDEEATIREDGKLVIFIKLPKGFDEISLILEQGEWKWIH